MTENKNETISHLQSIGQTYFGLDEKELREQQDVEGMIEYYIEKDYKKAKEIFERKENWFMLGVLYCEGEDVEQDYDKAKMYFNQAVEQGNSEGLVELGLLYFNGESVFRNYTKAKQYYEQAVEQGNSRALIGLATLYSEGSGVEKSYYTAYSYLKQAKKQGNQEAQEYIDVIPETDRSIFDLHEDVRDLKNTVLDIHKDVKDLKNYLKIIGEKVHKMYYR